MVELYSASTSWTGVLDSQELIRAAVGLREKLGRPATIAFAFVSAEYADDLEGFCETLRVDGHISTVVGCAASGQICNSEERENSAGVSVLSVAAEPGSFDVQVIEEGRSWSVESGPSILLLNPYEVNAEEWVSNCGPRLILGGLASGGVSADLCAVFVDGRVVDGVEVFVRPPVRLGAVVSQGCRPIGEPLTVTKADENVVYSLGARPAYQALESAFETLSEKEKRSAKGNLFAGLAGNEYVDFYRSGDFLVRTILGADPSSGAVAIGGIPRTGQTLQYQLRDSHSAHADLETELASVTDAWGRPSASLIFSCLGRGRNLFGTGHHDATMVQQIAGKHPSAGFFSNGEIGPIGGVPFLHTYSLACAFFGVDPSPSRPA